VDIPATSDNIPGTLVLRGATGDVKIGVASPPPHVTTPLTVTGGSTSGGAVVTYVYGSANAGITSYRANGTVENPTQVLSGERFAFLVGGTYGTTGFGNNPAAMNFHAAENQTDTARGSFITFDTCAVGQSGRQERLRIDASGNVFIGGTSGPSLTPKFGVHGYMVAQTTAAVDTPYVCHNTATSGDNQFINLATETTHTTRGQIDYNRGAGVVRYNTTSDETLKNVIGDADPSRSLEILSQTKLKNFSWKEDQDNKVQMGVIAQELIDVYPGAVSVGGETNTGYRPWAVDKTSFTFHLIAGWQEHAKVIQELTAKVEKLTAQVEALGVALQT
jgi:hypothetical protein